MIWVEGDATYIEPEMVYEKINGDHQVPVVPCDDAAVERAAEMLCREGMDFADGWAQGDTDRDYPRLIAEAVLRAAGQPQ